MAATIVDITDTSGWRGKINGSWVELPIKIDKLRAPVVASGCPGQLNIGNVGGTTTWDNFATVHHERSATSLPREEHDCCECPDGSEAILCSKVYLYPSITVDWTYGASLTLLPNLAKSVKRMVNQDYGALVFRGGMPLVRHIGFRECCKTFGTGCDVPPPNCLQFSTSSKTAHQRRPAAWNLVGQDEHAIEAPFKEDTIAPYHLYGTYDEVRDFTSETHIGGFCSDPDLFPICCFDDQRYRIYATTDVYFPSVDTRSISTGNPDMLVYLDHADPIARYINYSAHPHFSYFYFSPLDSDSDYWKLNGAKQTWDNYWGKLGEQHIDYSQLPGSERHKTRNTCFSPAFLEAPSAVKDFIKDYCVGVRVSHWGNGGIKAVNPSVPASKTLDSSSSSLWSFTSCTPTFGANIVLTPSAGTIRAKLNLGSFGVAPYLYPLIAKKIAVNWSNANVTSVSVKLSNQQGETKEIATSPGTYDMPTFADAYYAGSWAQNYGVGVISDIGTDDLANGRSSSTMLDPELVTAFELLGGWTAAELIFDIVCTGNVTLEYPTFYVSNSDGKVFVENRIAAALLFANGPGVRIGNWNCWDSDAADLFTSTPAVRLPGEKMSILDALVYQRLLFEGKSKSDNLATQIAALFDSIEGNTKNDVRQGCIGYLAEGGRCGTLILVNGYDCPPISNFPRGALDSNFQETSVYAQEAFALDVEPRYYVAPHQAVHLEEPTDPRTRWTSTSSLGPAGWNLTKHLHELTNSEGVTFKIVRDPDGDFATVSPYHSYLAVIGTEPPTASWPSLDCSYSGRHIRSYIKDGSIWFGKSGNESPKVWADADTGIASDFARVRFSSPASEQQIYLLYHDSGNINLSISNDEGTTWGAPMVVASGTYGDLRRIRPGVLAIYFKDGGAIKGKLYDAQLNVIKDTFTIVASGVDDAGMAVHDFMGAGATQRFGLLYTASGSLTYLESTDGINFS